MKTTLNDYKKLLVLTLVLVAIEFIPVIRAQKAPDAPASIVKAFPPGLSAEMEKANNDLQLAKAQQIAANFQVDTANANIRALLFKASKEMNLSKFEEDNCPYARNQNGAWIFSCPPEKKSEPPKDDKAVKP